MVLVTSWLRVESIVAITGAVFESCRCVGAGGNMAVVVHERWRCKLADTVVGKGARRRAVG